MTKIKIILMLTLLLQVFSMTAQRRLSGMNGIYAYGGMIESTHGLHGGLAYSKYLKNQNQLSYEASYLQKNYSYKDMKIPLMQFTIESVFHKNFFMDKTRSFFASASIGGAFGYEAINLNRKLLPDGAAILNKDAVLYGATFAIHTEYYYDDRYVILFGVKQRALGGSTVTNFHTQFYLGFKYILL